jgi:hypothetical protein
MFLISQCAWCKAIKQEDGSYKKFENIKHNLPLATHGICPECVENQTTHQKVRTKCGNESKSY